MVFEEIDNLRAVQHIAKRTNSKSKKCGKKMTLSMGSMFEPPMANHKIQSRTEFFVRIFLFILNLSRSYPTDHRVKIDDRFSLY